MKTRAFRSIRVSTVCLLCVWIGGLACGKEPDGEGLGVEASPADSIIVLPASAMQTGQVASEDTRVGSLADTLVVTGEIQPDPQRTAHIAPRITGTVQTVTAVSGTRVRHGQVLATLYSPEFQVAQMDFVLADQRVDRARVAGVLDLASLENIARSSRHRLEVLGASEADLQRLQDTHEPMQSLSLGSPITGVVTSVQAAVGKQVGVGEDLFTIADLSILWAVVHIYEQDVGRLQIGQTARVIANAYPGREFDGEVSTIDGALDAETRTLKVLIRITNRDLALKPAMFASARIATGVPRQAMVVPESAVQELAGIKVVFVAYSDTSFVARPVSIRTLGRGLVEILGGIQPGTRLATRGAFLVKSQAQKSEFGEE